MLIRYLAATTRGTDSHRLCNAWHSSPPEAGMAAGVAYRRRCPCVVLAASDADVLSEPTRQIDALRSAARVCAHWLQFLATVISDFRFRRAGCLFICAGELERQ